MKKHRYIPTQIEMIFIVPAIVGGIVALIEHFKERKLKAQTQRGASIVEYTLLVALVLVIAVAIYGTLHHDKDDGVVHRRPVAPRYVTTTTAIPQSCVSGTNGNVVVVEDAGCPATSK